MLFVLLEKRRSWRWMPSKTCSSLWEKPLLAHSLPFHYITSLCCPQCLSPYVQLFFPIAPHALTCPLSTPLELTVWKCAFKRKWLPLCQIQSNVTMMIYCICKKQHVVIIMYIFYFFNIFEWLTFKSKLKSFPWSYTIISTKEFLLYWKLDFMRNQHRTVDIKIYRSGIIFFHIHHTMWICC